jgi:hypothetical protein
MKAHAPGALIAIVAILAFCAVTAWEILSQVL